MGRFVDEGTSPCKHCADRTLGCHGICKDYVEWQEMVAKRRRWLRKQKAQTAIHKGSRLASPARELPIGVVTSFIGGPLFLILLNYRRGGYAQD